MRFPLVKRRLRRRDTFNMMRIAVEGCCHGTLDQIYAEVGKINKQNKIDMLLICGDFEAIRNAADLECMAVPQKYRTMGDFSKYYVGKAQAPVLTIVIGGNHEASNYLWELYHGGWLAPNIYFLGFSGCIQVNGVRIAGSSGIYKSHDYHLGYYEKQPFDNSTMRSIYHTRKYDVTKLSQLTHPNVVLSHDWPRSIENHGNTAELFRRKPHFRSESLSGILGSPPMLHLLKTLKPEWWFSAHMHVRFEAMFDHNPNPVVTANVKMQLVENPDEIKIDDIDIKNDTMPDNPDEIVIEDEIDQSASKTTSTVQSRQTRFLALDKCLPGRRFLEIVNIATPVTTNATPSVTFDPEWLAITRALHPYLSLDRHQRAIPRTEELKNLVDIERAWVKQNLPNSGLIEISQIQQFAPTAPGPQPGKQYRQQPTIYTNPQTEALMGLLQLPNKINPRSGHVSSKIPCERHTTTGSHQEELLVKAVTPSELPSSSTNDQTTNVPPVENERDTSSGGWSPSRVTE